MSLLLWECVRLLLEGACRVSNNAVDAGVTCAPEEITGKRPRPEIPLTSMEPELVEVEARTIRDHALAARARLAKVRESHPYMTDRRMNEQLDALSGELEDLVIQASRLGKHVFGNSGSKSRSKPVRTSK